ncbi:hypothetical protein TG4357_00794 [Thalassovita gelatinovora]|uniref:Uncharacterized protein n=1 Tax=Thalassovita gelatinovora TaxID=53501 RepID=A0A0P1F7N6_THAGE|nr:hypothetical protein [Thalassovita gelatinovora]QIZ79168.1 hypothetical protein HFZ77_01115 [Thalassovita gelatinovora]CUH63629.1 hypothetical protein TG4357_00794 [Thalassovita gelatinovora]SER00713.1 hypothetical protein SAMN04488043_11335 [Thalassovita gelatinovora]
MPIEETPDGLAEPFQDILDGYFTLKESVRQMMARHDFSWAWLTLHQAPVMDISGLAPDEPVPLHLRDGYAGLIDTMMLTVLRPGTQGSDEFVLIGIGEWQWLDNRAHTDLPKDIRLGEPAYFSGFGLSTKKMPDPKRIAASDVLADVPASLADFGRLRPFSA